MSASSCEFKSHLRHHHWQQTDAADAGGVRFTRRWASRDPRAADGIGTHRDTTLGRARDLAAHNAMDILAFSYHEYRAAKDDLLGAPATYRAIPKCEGQQENVGDDAGAHRLS